MIWEWLIAAAVMSTAILFTMYLPNWLERRANSYKNIATLAHEFYATADKIAADKRTPKEVLKLLAVINQRFADPNVVREIVWAALRGRLSEHAKSPSPKARAFLKSFNNMPEDLKSHFASAIVCSLLASAEKAGLFGIVFVRMMLFNPIAQKQSDAPTYASKIASSEMNTVPAA